MNEQGSSRMVVMAAIALVVGAAGGYALGNSQGRTQGRATLLVEQEVAAQADIDAAQAEIAAQANPFGGAENANPFEGSYQNPFEGGAVNPFAQ